MQKLKLRSELLWLGGGLLLLSLSLLLFVGPGLEQRGDVLLEQETLQMKVEQLQQFAQDHPNYAKEAWLQQKQLEAAKAALAPYRDTPEALACVRRTAGEAAVRLLGIKPQDGGTAEVGKQAGEAAKGGKQRPQLVRKKLQLQVNGDFFAVQGFLATLEKSGFNIVKVHLTGEEDGTLKAEFTVIYHLLQTNLNKS